MTSQFSAYIGIDYSGAKTAASRLKGLRVFKATHKAGPMKVWASAQEKRNWTRKEVADWCCEQLQSEDPVIMGIDHGFSFPLSYMKRYGITSWDQFLEDFHNHWPTDQDNRSAESLRYGNQRTGNHTELRLSENWTASAQSVFKLDGAGTVGKSTHCGVPWLRYMRRNTAISSSVHFWPFDGFEIPPKKSVIAEIFPSILRRRYSRKEHHTADDHDARCVARWLKDMDTRAMLRNYFNPPLTDEEREIARLEGWILGIY
jgi:hypothetical protein